MRRARYLLLIFVVILVPAAVGQQLPKVVVTKMSVVGYPPLARQASQQGDVTAKVSLDGNGRVVNLTEISGPDMLRGAMNIVKDWEFALSDNTPVTIPMTFRFKLTGEERVCARSEFSAELPGLVLITTSPTSEKPGPDSVFKPNK